MKDPCVLLIDDHAMFREGLRFLIGMAITQSRVFEANSLDEALSSTLERVDVVLLDIQLNGMNALEHLHLLQHKWPLTPVLILSADTHPETVHLALARGAAAFISKAETSEKIVQAILKIFQATSFLPSAVPAIAAQRRLTPRQGEVLTLLHQGLSNKLIARKLSLSDNTVRRHVQDILEFFGATNRAEAVYAAYHQKLIG